MGHCILCLTSKAVLRLRTESPASKRMLYQLHPSLSLQLGHTGIPASLLHGAADEAGGPLHWLPGSFIRKIVPRVRDQQGENQTNQVRGLPAEHHLEQPRQACSSPCFISQVISTSCSLQGQPISLSLLCKAPKRVPDIKEEEVGRTGSKGRGGMCCFHFPPGEFNT